MYFLAVLCLFSTLSAVPIPDKSHANSQENFLSPQDFPPVSLYFMQKRPYLEIHMIKIKISPNELGPPGIIPNVFWELNANDFDDSYRVKKNGEEKFKYLKKYLKRDADESKIVDDPKDPEKPKDSSPSIEPQEDKTANKVEESTKGEKEDGSKEKESGEEKNGDKESGEKNSGEKEGGEKDSGEKNSEEKGPHESVFVQPDEHKKPSIIDIFSSLFHVFGNILPNWFQKSGFTGQRYYIIAVESDFISV